MVYFVFLKFVICLPQAGHQNVMETIFVFISRNITCTDAYW